MIKEENQLPITGHLRHAGSASARAEIVLRMPLAILLSRYLEIVDILAEYGDEPILHYVRQEHAALHAVRDMTGAIPLEKRTISDRVMLLQAYVEPSCQTL